MTPNEPKFSITRSASVDLSLFVKLAYLLIGSAAAVYFGFELRQGGSLAAAADNASLGLMYGVAGLIIVFGVVVVGSSLRKS